MTMIPLVLRQIHGKSLSSPALDALKSLKAKTHLMLLSETTPNIAWMKLITTAHQSSKVVREDLF